MISPKVLNILIICAAFFSASCGFFSNNENTNTTVFVAEEVKSGIPFSTREPDNFQADIIVTAAGAERKYSIARSGRKRIVFFNRGAAGELAVLQTEDGKTLTISQAKKNYTENNTGASYPSNELTEYLTTEWLSRKTGAVFTKLEPENNLTRYRVRLADSDNSEILIYFDENLQMPVRQEFYAVSGDQKNLTYTVEIKNFQTPADESLFVIPGDFKKNE